MYRGRRGKGQWLYIVQYQAILSFGSDKAGIAMRSDVFANKLASGPTFTYVVSDVETRCIYCA